MHNHMQTSFYGFTAMRIQLSTCEINLESGHVWVPGRKPTRLNTVLLQLLKILVDHEGNDVPHDLLRRQVWSDRLERESELDRRQKMRKVYIAITRLRRILGDDARPYRHIISSRPGSYRFQPLTVVGLGPAPSASSNPTP